MEAEITWENNGNDYSAKVGEYELNVHYSAPVNKWLSICRYFGKAIHAIGRPTLEQAKDAATQAYLKHSKENKI